MKRNSNDIDIYKHLTQEELLDYSNEVLGNDQMYRLELHLNECELCSDAIEGISNLKNSEAILKEINSSILPAKKGAFKANYMAIAASIALIVVFGLSYWLISTPSKVETIAINTPTELKQEPNQSRAEEQPASTTEASKITSDEQMTQGNFEQEDPTISNKEVAIAEYSATPEVSEKQKSIIRPKEVEPAKQPMEIAEVTTEIQQPVEEEIPFEESDLGASDDISLSEVQPVQSAARVSKKSNASQSTTSKDQKEPIPVGGVANLKNYINENLNYPQQAIDNKIKGTVVLEVTIGINGEIKNIYVTKSIGYGCDAEAIRLISNGPKWSPAVANGMPIETKKLIKVKFKN